MIKRPAFIALAVVSFILLAAGDVYTFTSGAPAGRSGGAGEASCATSSCHSGTANSGAGLVTLTSDAPNGIYTPGMTYTITAEVQQSGISRFGFQVLSGFSSVTNASVGTTSILNASETKIVSSGQRRYVTQTTAGSLGSNSRVWSFSWTAPNPAVGDVEFFVSGNAANNNGNRSGDDIYTGGLTLSAPPVNVEEALLETDLSLYPGIATDRINFVLNGAGLAPLQALVIDASGRTVERLELTPAGSELRRSLDVTSFAPGVYYLRITGEQVEETGKFVKF